MRARRSSTGCWRAGTTALSSCASRIPTPSDPPRPRSRASSRISRWLGLEWDEGPDVGGPCGPYRQSERLHLYTSYANELLAAGHAYYCFCPPQKLEEDRRRMLEEGKPPRYAGTCRSIGPDEAQRRIEGGERPVVRFRVPEHVEVTFQDLVRGDVTFNTDVIGDPVLVRSDGRPQYNFAVVIDDALMEVTHVIRGEDHISNTPRQVLLYQALGFSPPKFAHLALVMGPDHTPLSKRHGATSVSEFRARGYLPEALTNCLALIGWSPRTDAGSVGTAEELLPLDELARRFALEHVGHSAGIFDLEKLAWMNRHYMKAAAPGRLAAESRALLHRPRLRRATDRHGVRLHRIAAADGGGLGRSPRGDSGSAGVPVHLRSVDSARAPAKWRRSCANRARATSLPRSPTRSTLRSSIARRSGRWPIASRSGPARRARRSSIRSASR